MQRNVCFDTDNHVWTCKYISYLMDLANLYWLGLMYQMYQFASDDVKIG